VNLDDTIIAWATGRASLARRDDPGAAARMAIIRATGPGVFESSHALANLLTPPPAPPRSAFGGGAICGRSMLALGDASLSVRWIAARGPRTYSGQDTLELLVPAGPVIVPRVLAVLRGARGAPGASADGAVVRDAEPGEFTARAFFLGRLSLAQAEGVARTIAAQSREALQAARAMRDDDGAAAARLAAWRDEAAMLLALVEAGIDFADQEGVVAIAPQELHARATALASSLHAAAGDAGGSTIAPTAEPIVVLLGPPNAGKSTLFNALTASETGTAPGTSSDRAEASLVSPIAGTTRDARSAPWSMHVPGLGVVHLRLVDAPGLDIASDDALDIAAQARTHAALREANLALLCDEHARFDDLAAVASREDRNLPTVRVRTKADRAAAPSPHAVNICALTGHGLDALRTAVTQALWPTTTPTPTPTPTLAPAATPTGEVMLLPAHRAALHAAATHLRAAASCATDHRASDPALIAADLRAALDALGPLTGDVPPDDILGRIFGSFCIGK
jgi:tRNA modification GTPase